MSEFYLAEVTVRVWNRESEVKHTLTMLTSDSLGVVEAQNLIKTFQNYLDEQHVTYEEKQTKSRFRVVQPDECSEE
jgi:hypothetical protein